MKPIIATVNTIENVAFSLSQLTLVGLMLITTFDALARYLLSGSLFGDVYQITSEYMMPFLVYLSLSYVFRIGGHIRVTILTRLMPENMQNVLMQIMNILSIGLFAWITYASYHKALEAFTTGEYSSSILAYPLWPAYGVVVVGTVLLFIRLILTVITRENPYAEGEAEEV